jgi:hypothetical protein
MTSIDELIQREINPFDRVNLKPGNFWQAQSQAPAAVQSIHQAEIRAIEGYLNLVATDHVSRSILLVGDSGAGKSFLLDRLRQTFNDKAFFVYIGPWADSSYIWRHVLRYTVDSLMQIPVGHSESQLMQWLKGLSAFTKRSLKQRLFNDSVWGLLQNDRQKFINHLKKTYKTANIHSPDRFFGMLHDLTDPDLYDLACEWLRGDDLSEESLQLLRVKHSVEAEDDAKTILANISKIATDTQPIVLCFDQLDNIPEQHGIQDFQPLFNVNTLLHNDGLKNFLVIVSIITNTWRDQIKRIKPADTARFEGKVNLKPINLEQATALWTDQLRPLHQAAKPQPISPIFPLELSILETTFPGGKALPRHVIALGKQAYQQYKLDPPPSPGPIAPPMITPPPAGRQLEAEFKLEWEREQRKTAAKILKLTSRSAPELMQMLQEVLSALEVPDVKLKLLTGTYASYSLQYQDPKTAETIGVIWTEDASMQSFYHIMNACQKIVGQRCQKLQLLRAGTLGTPKTAGNKIYQQLFDHTQHQHVKPILISVHAIATYHSLVNAAKAKELVLSGQTILLPELARLTRQTLVLQACQLLQDLGIMPPSNDPVDATAPLIEYVMNRMTTEMLMGVATLIALTTEQFPQSTQAQIQQVIQQLCVAKQLRIVDPKLKLDHQIICWEPSIASGN